MGLAAGRGVGCEVGRSVGRGEMETADVRKGRGMWKERESCLGIWVAWLEEEEEQPARKSEKGRGWGRGVGVTCLPVVRDSNNDKCNNNHHSNDHQRQLRVNSA